MREKEELTMKMKDCEVQLERAKKLTDGLSDEKERWTNDIERLKGNLDMLPGNSAVSASMLTYSGPFNAQYRQELEQSWIKRLEQLDIKHTKDTTMRSYLGDDVKI